jgi:hypothetical protein
MESGFVVDGSRPQAILGGSGHRRDMPEQPPDF